MVLPIALLDTITASTSRNHSRPFSHPAWSRWLLSCRTVNTSARRLAKTSANPYSATVNLPTTAFPLRAEAEKREKLFRRRTTDDLYDWQAKQTDRPLFILHDGPPYANGNLHTGHSMNKTLKDIINRSKLLQGHRVHYVPGYDTHGLPLELKALSTLKKPASSLSPQEIRAAARQEALKGIDLQGTEFREFGGMGAFRPGEAYQTLDWSYEKRQLHVFKDMVARDLITTHHRPTLYSPSSRTALAEAELEYREDHISRSVYVGFPIVDLGDLTQVPGFPTSGQVKLAVWTTTAWTLPSNVAIAVSESMQYVLARDNTSQNLFIVAEERLQALSEVLSSSLETLATFPGSTLLSTTYKSPLAIKVNNYPRPIIPAPYVTGSTGTGLVHTAPAHGMEDWAAWRAFRTAKGLNLEDVVCAVDGAGKFSGVLDSLVDVDVEKILVGKDVLKDGTASVIDVLSAKGMILQEVEVQHKFPYDWRTKKPVIFRASSQWFANLERVKDDAVRALGAVDFHPSRGRQALEMFVRGRSEWCISRQRAWGVPIPVVYSHSESNPEPQPLLTPSNIEHIISVLDSKGSGTDYWWQGKAEEFVEPTELARSKREGRVWRKGTDTMDVWFDSGASWTYIRELGLRPSGSPADSPFADVYLEGSDQHRGWFQSSLLTAISASNQDFPKAPYGTVITHGMVLDEKGRKMSKSLGNVLSPLTIIHGGKNLKKEPAYGVDLLRFWVASVDYTRDVPIGPSILSQTFEGLRKIRNTARFLLGNLNGARIHQFALPDLGLIERYILHELATLDQTAREGYDTFTFNKVHQALLNFSNTTLSFYFDVVKDSLYSDSKDSGKRSQVIFVLRKILDIYTHVLAPIAPHLAEEIHHFDCGATADPLPDDKSSSFFEKVWPRTDPSWLDGTVKAETEELLILRDLVMSLLEQARTEKLVGSSSEAIVVINNPAPLVEKHFSVLKSLFIVSDVQLRSDADSMKEANWKFSGSTDDGSEVTVLPAEHYKCPRCWTFASAAEDTLCGRCVEVLRVEPIVEKE
ncbi:isoleucyl-tRNA synthetase [Meredithblackwellia eburnea MCA 4105]